MEIIFVLSFILLSIAISLGVGSSTIAISNFFVAISDGTMEPGERRIMGVTYIVLRVAMVLILLMYLVQLMYGYTGVTTAYYGSTTAVAVGLLISVLYINAGLMTYKIMPSNFGPSIQASSWYTLGVVAALANIGISNYSFLTFLAGYGTFFTMVTITVNLLLHHLVSKKIAR